ncbi:MAG: hypothetical protein LGB78_04065 [Sulfurovum sp.]|nr:hypothetical protein [Sulfurovum sp.]
MTLRGIMDNSLGGYLTFRGFARLEDIEKLSEADAGYQRDLIETHATEITEFLDSGKNLFFPEVILGCRLADTDEIPELERFYTASTGIISNDFSFNKMKIKLGTAIEFQSGDDIRNKGKYRSATLKFLQAHQRRIETHKPFTRIDGNHRISASLGADERIKKLNVPFCIVFFRDEDEERKYSRILFHNINYKSIPLAMEDSLKLILDDTVTFDDDELKESTAFGWEYYFARQIKQDDIRSYFPNISGVLNDKFRSAFLKLFQLLLQDSILEKDDNEIDKVKEALGYLDTSIYNNSQLKESQNIAVFSAFLYYQLKAPELINFLKSWVLKNEIYNINELEPNSIIKIMDNIASHKVKKVFVAMPYYNHARVTEYNRMFKEALDQIDAPPFTLELIPIMRNKGESERIDERLLKQISECDIFIADLSTMNLNVMYETAYAEGKGIPSLLIKQEPDLDTNDEKITLPFDMDKRQYVPFPKDSYYGQIQSIVKHNLPAMLQS